MCRLLVLFRHEPVDRVPGAVLSLASAAASAGPRVRMHAYETSGLRAAIWADAVAFGIDERNRTAPAEVKHWFDRLGFGGWLHMRDKPGCVFPTRTRGGNPSLACGDRVADILRQRGMEAVTAPELVQAVPGGGQDDAGAAIGRAFGQHCMDRTGVAAPVAVAAANAVFPRLPDHV